MKLQLKHIAPYLPYELKAVKGITRIKLTAVNLELPQIYHTSYLGSRLRVVSDINSIKPILRPLSDLTKEIEVNGIKMNPITNLKTQGYHLNFDDEFTFEDFIKSDILNNSYGFIDLLIKWHFDVFGLIENGIAVDINTLNQ